MLRCARSLILAEAVGRELQHAIAAITACRSSVRLHEMVTGVSAGTRWPLRLVLADQLLDQGTAAELGARQRQLWRCIAALFP